MELKLASAGRAGRPISGGDELLIRLQELGDAPVQGFAFEGEHDTIAIYASIAHQELAGYLPGHLLPVCGRGHRRARRTGP
jgi:hypothetical protein